MSHRDLVIYGSGGHGQLVAEAAVLAGRSPIGYIDDNPEAVSRFGPPVLPHDELDTFDRSRVMFALGIGDNANRQRIARMLVSRGFTLATIVHPRAFVSPSAVLSIGSDDTTDTVRGGVFIGPKAIVHTLARVDAGVIVNSGAIVEHHCHVGEFAHLAPRAVLGGNATVGTLTLMGLGSVVLPMVRVGARATVGAGAVVIKDVPDGSTVAGVPAVPIR